MTGKWSGGGLSGLLVAVTLVALCLSLLVAIAVSAPAVAAQDTGDTTENSTDTEPDSSDEEPDSSEDEDTDSSDEIGSVNLNIGGDSSDESGVTDTIEREISSTTRVYDVSEPDDGMVTVTIEVDRTSRVTLTDGMSGYNDDGGEFITRTYTLEEGTHEIQFPLEEWDGAMSLTIADSDAAHGFPIEPPTKGPPIIGALTGLEWHHIAYAAFVGVNYVGIRLWRREDKASETIERVI